jgi:hypothetical protein
VIVNDLLLLLSLMSFEVVLNGFVESLRIVGLEVLRETQ